MVVGREEKERDENSSGNMRLSDSCGTLKSCREIQGTCRKKKTGCVSGESQYLSTQYITYCRSKGCACCSTTQGVCVTKKKCASKKGTCIIDPASCNGRIKTGKGMCGTSSCVCCLPPKSCKTQTLCTQQGGSCGNLLTLRCLSTPLVGKQYCKGKQCGCCLNPDTTPTWGYTKKNGPATWPTNFPQCGGSQQSPVALVTASAQGTYPYIPFKFDLYTTVSSFAILTNTGHTAAVTLSKGGQPAVMGGDLDGKYDFFQLHFHWGKSSRKGSEHTIDGKRYSGEIHFVHYKDSYGNLTEATKHSNGIAVLAVMLEESTTDNTQLNPIINGLSKIRTAGQKTSIAPLALSNLLPTNVDNFFRYNGSFTTPPCSQVVVWTVFRDPVSISSGQLEMFRSLMDDQGNLLVQNIRPLQPLNGRVVLKGRLTPYWSYVPPFAPSNWSVNFPTCGSGMRQSPIALVTSTAVGTYPRLNIGFRNYSITPVGMTLLNTGHYAEVLTTFEPGAQASIKGGTLSGRYVLAQFHFHWGGNSTVGSEHTIDGKRYPGELHIVHYKAAYGSVTEATKYSDGLAVLGIMLTLSQVDNQRLSLLTQQLNDVDEAGTETTLTPFPLQNLLPANTDDYFSYNGSFTTPPCSESVIWNVFKSTIPISEKQLGAFRMLLDDGGNLLQNNFRPLQPLNGREVQIASLTRRWSYIGATGPANWASIYPTCGSNRQSPIALVTSTSTNVGYNVLTFANYNRVPTTMTILNSGHTAQIVMGTSYVPTVSGGNLANYTFVQFHFHWGSDDTMGSEHTIDSVRYPSELHIVHYKTMYGSLTEAIKYSDGIAVLAIMIEATSTDNVKFQPIIAGLANVHVAETEAEIVPFAIQDLLPTNTKNFFRYDGSFTTPACDEVAIWTVFKDTVKLSRTQLAEFRKLEDDSGLQLVNNYRPLQNLAGRTVYYSV